MRRGARSTVARSTAARGARRAGERGGRRAARCAHRGGPRVAGGALGAEPVRREQRALDHGPGWRPRPDRRPGRSRACPAPAARRAAAAPARRRCSGDPAPTPTSSRRRVRHRRVGDREVDDLAGLALGAGPLEAGRQVQPHAPGEGDGVLARGRPPVDRPRRRGPPPRRWCRPAARSRRSPGHGPLGSPSRRFGPGPHRGPGPKVLSCCWRSAERAVSRPRS